MNQNDWSTFITDNPALAPLVPQLETATNRLVECFNSGNKLALCGNGGSYADAQHIAGELGKEFKIKRPLSPELVGQFGRLFGERGLAMAERLQRGLPVVVLESGGSLATAFENDADAALVYAQQALTMLAPGDVFLGISTSGNAANVIAAAMAARVRGAYCVALTGGSGGELAPLCDCAIIAPEHEVYRVQEQHIRLYHAICIAVEQRMFGKA